MTARRVVILVSAFTALFALALLMTFVLRWDDPERTIFDLVGGMVVAGVALWFWEQE